MDYQSVFLFPTIEIHDIVTVHYFEYCSDFHFPGESHDFWEFLCVDKGEIHVTANAKDYDLTRGDIIFHQPNEFHRLRANYRVAPNLVVIAFVCHSPAMDFFRERILSIDSFERNLLGQIIVETKNTFMDPLDDPGQKRMHKKDHILTGSEQMIQLNLELFLLHLLRRHTITCNAPVAKETIKQKSNDALYHRILEYLNLHLAEQLSIDDIADDTLIGRSQLQHLIREKEGCGVIDLFSRMKINQAKEFIRENNLNFTEISIALGYSSVHYFSRQFKKLTGMTPSEYSSSIKKMMDE